MELKPPCSREKGGEREEKREGRGRRGEESWVSTDVPEIRPSSHFPNTPILACVLGEGRLRGCDGQILHWALVPSNVQGGSSISSVSGGDRQVFIKEILCICWNKDNGVWDPMAGDTEELKHLPRY